MVLEHEADAVAAQPRQRRVVERAGLLAARSSSRPAVGRSSRPMMLSSVLLPEPDGPDQRAELAALRARGRCRAAPRSRPACRRCRTCARRRARRTSRSARQPRIATTGSSRAARSAGATAASTPVSVAPAAARPTNSVGSSDQREQRRAVGVARQRVPEQQRQPRRAPSRAASRRSPSSAALEQEHPQDLRRARCPSRAGCRSRATSAPPRRPARWRCRSATDSADEDADHRVRASAAR